jgi:RNA polymerase sigma-70 factor (ECF subfamily)
VTTDLQPLIDAREDLLAFVRKRVNDPDLAEDILQSSLLKAVRSAPAVEREDRLVPWFYRILRNAIIDSYRARGSTDREVPLEPELSEELEEDSEVYRVACECVLSLISDLKPEYSQLIEALDIEQRPTEAVAAELGITATNLKVRRHRARQALRRSLEQTCRICAEHHCLDCTCEAAPRV